jgi:hypothetical protein
MRWAIESRPFGAFTDFSETLYKQSLALSAARSASPAIRLIHHSAFIISA